MSTFTEIYDESYIIEDEFIKNIKDMLVLYSKNFSRITRKITEFPLLLNELNSRIDNKGNSISEKLFILLYPEKVPNICQFNNIIQFNTFKKGYWKFCSPKSQCKCFKQAQSKVIKKHKPHEKSLSSYKEKTGYDNPMKNPEVKEKLARTNLKKYGSISPMGNKEIREKAKKTINNNYGVDYPLQNKDILNKAHNTNRKNNGDCFKKAREAYSKTIGFGSIFQSDDWQKENREKLFKKYGTYGPNKIPHVREQMIEKEMLKNNCEHYTQRHWSDETKKIMLDENIDWIEYVKENGGIESTAKFLKVSEGVISRKLIDNNPNYKSSKSSIEDSIEKILIDNNISYVKNSRSIIKPYELDFYIPEFNIAIEYDSFKYHTDDNEHIDRNYHKNKTNLCQSKNIQLIHIFQNEWFEKYDIIKRKILNLCKKSEKGVGARKCNIKKIDWNIAKSFMDEYHIQGSGTGSTVSYGCFYGEILIGVMTFIYQNKEWILNRYSSNGKNNPGMASKILKHFIKDYSPNKIVSFADLRYSYGELYYQLGFEVDKILNPDYSYINGNQLMNKRKFRKDKIQKKYKINITNKTELELTTELGLKRIWDCGKIRFVLNINQ